MDDRTQQAVTDGGWPPPPGVLVVDGTGRVRRCNRRMARALGSTVAGTKGRPFADLLGPGWLAASTEHLIDSVAASGTAAVGPLNLAPGTDGVPVVLLVRAEPLTGPRTGDPPAVRLTELDSRGGLDVFAHPLHLAGRLGGVELWVYSREERRFTTLGDAQQFTGVPMHARLTADELLARVHEDDVDRLRQALLTPPPGYDVDPPWVRFRARDTDGRWRSLASRSCSYRQGLTGGTVQVTVVREQRPREQLLGALSVERERVKRVADVSAALISATSEQEFSRIIIDTVAEAFGGNGTLLGFADNGRLRIPEGLGLDQRYRQSMDGMPLTAPRILPYAIRTGEPQFVASREEFAERWPAGREFLTMSNANSGAVVPFGTLDGGAAGGWAVTYETEYVPSVDERTLMRTLAHLAGQALERIRLQQARLDLARVLQESMLPPRPARLPGLETAARYVPARRGLDIGGDWYDAFPLAEDTVALVIGDVQGHDVDAAAFMGQVRTSIRAFSCVDPDPGTVLARTNDLLVSMAVPTFASCTFLRYDPRDGRVAAARAGHVPLVWASGDGSYGVRDLEGGTLLGVLPHAEFPTHTFTLPRGALLALVTDGVVEGPAQTMDEGLGHASAVAADSLRRQLDAEKTADRLLAGAEAVGHEDDAAVLLVRRR